MRGWPPGGGDPLTGPGRRRADPPDRSGFTGRRAIPVDSDSALPPRRLLRGSRQLTHLVGTRLLVGITVRDAQGGLIRQEQFCGTVLSVDDGVVVVHRGGAPPMVLPADPEAYERAPSGTYTLAGTGTEIVDPDYVTTWVVREQSDP
jgi:hypothetical protein